jgi:hypothetical protein
MTSIAIALPGSLWPEQSGVEPYDGLRVPALTGALVPARAQIEEARAWSGLLMKALTGSEYDAPFALVSQHVSGKIDPNQTWLRADPVHYVAGREDVALGSLHDFNVSESDAAQCIEALNAHFAQDGLLWHALSPKQWLLRAPGALEVQTVDPWAGMNMPARYVPMLGPHARQLRRWTTEAQMLLHEHPVNVERQARGERAINSVWMWAAGGALPSALENVGLVSSCTNANFLGSALKIGRFAPQVFGYFPDLMGTFFQGDAAQWREALTALFANEIAPLLRECESVELILGGQRPQVRVPLASARGVRGWLRNAFGNDAMLGPTLAQLGALK